MFKIYAFSYLFDFLNIHRYTLSFGEKDFFLTLALDLIK